MEDEIFDVTVVRVTSTGQATAVATTGAITTKTTATRRASIIFDGKRGPRWTGNQPRNIGGDNLVEHESH